MISKLKQRIFLIIMVPLTVIIVGIIGTFTYLNYKNTVRTTSFLMDGFENGLANKNIQNQVNIEGIYKVFISNSNYIFNSNSSKTQKLKDYSSKIISNKKDSGIIGKYIYKVRKNRNNSYEIVFILSFVAGCIIIVAIYFGAKKLSEIIVKPVEETFEKQKQFISDASHELKTPLAVIEANSDVLESNVGENKWIGYIQKEIDSMNKLINELLLLTKIENVDNTREYEKFDLSKEIEIITSTFEGMAYERQIKIDTNIEENIIFNGNKEDIKHILSTLIDNAIKHTEEKNDIKIELKKEKGKIILQVKNKGEEIPKEEREKIFERFYRVDKSRNRNEKRYGLGLAIAKATVEKYRGQIEVLYEDKYTIFKVELPN